MKYNESYITYPSARGENAYGIRIYESAVEFSRRDFFAHRHSDLELSLILSGNGTYRFETGEMRIEAGDIFLFGSKCIHCITEVFPGEEMRLLNVQFEPRFLWSPLANMMPREYVGLFSGKCEKLPRPSDIHAQIRKNLECIREESMEKRLGYATVIRSRLCESLTALMRDGEHNVPTQRNDERRTLLAMDEVMDYINASIDSPLTLEQLADYAGFGRSYFSTLFKSLNGLSPWEYIMIRRLELAKGLLRQTSYSVLEISERSGFSNLSHFNRVFLRSTGMTPREYRQKGRPLSPEPCEGENHASEWNDALQSKTYIP